MGRISALTELTTLASDDYLVVLDSSANIAKKITIANAFGLPDFGWTATGESWTFSSYSATTQLGVVTIPADGTTKYSVDMWVRISQATGGTKYGRIIAVTSTSLTIFFSTYTLNNEAITSPVYSAEYIPVGLPTTAQAWIPFVPTLVNITIGNGSLTARYHRKGRFVTVRFTLVFGTTTAVTGDLGANLPLTSVAIQGTAVVPYLGGIRLFDTSGSGVYPGHVIHTSTTAVGFRPETASGTYTTQAVGSSTVPFTWATGDEVHAEYTYEAA